jgi:hypothetical protein
MASGDRKRKTGLYSEVGRMPVVERRWIRILYWRTWWRRRNRAGLRNETTARIATSRAVGRSSPFLPLTGTILYEVQRAAVIAVGGGVAAALKALAAATL